MLSVINKLIEYVIVNWEEMFTILLTTVITISVVLKRTKIERKVKQMNDMRELELTIEEMELIRHIRETKAAAAAPLDDELKTKIRERQNEINEEERLKEEKRLKEKEKEILPFNPKPEEDKELMKNEIKRLTKEITEEVLTNYHEIKTKLKILKEASKKYILPDHIENELKENE